MLSSADLDFTERVSPRDCPELMDGDCTYEEFRSCLISLEQVNRWLFGYRPTIAWLNRQKLKRLGVVHIVDVGCGGGDLLREISIWAKNRGIVAQLTGIDLNPYAIRAAREFTPPELAVNWVTGDALTHHLDSPVDIVVSSLMTHHLEDDEIISLLRWMDATCKAGWFINDLERSSRNGRLFGLLAAVANWHPFVKHDGPVSFRRAFLKRDWYRLLRAAAVDEKEVTVEHWRPGRLCIGKISHVSD